MNIIFSESRGKSYGVAVWIATPKWARPNSRNRHKINRMYKQAKILTKETKLQWTVDHIIPLRGTYVSGLHCIDNLVLLCEEANRIKGNSFNMSS